MVLQEGSSDLDGAPMDNTLIDGLPLDGEPVDHLDGRPMGWDPLDGAPVDDIDGIPLGAAIDDIDGMPCGCPIPVLSLMFICTTCVRMVCIHIGCCQRQWSLMSVSLNSISFTLIQCQCMDGSSLLLV